MTRMRSVRWRLELALAVLFGAGALVTAFFPRWIEAFGFEPDGGGGSAEWTIVVVLGLAAVVSALVARSHFARRLKSMEIAAPRS